MCSLELVDVDTDLLVTLDVLLITGSASAAADRLGTCPTVICRRLQRLRELFDDPLLLVGSKGLVPTPCARSIASHLDQLGGGELPGRAGHMEPAGTQLAGERLSGGSVAQKKITPSERILVGTR